MCGFLSQLRLPRSPYSGASVGAVFAAPLAAGVLCLTASRSQTVISADAVLFALVVCRLAVEWK